MKLLITILGITLWMGVYVSNAQTNFVNGRITAFNAFPVNGAIIKVNKSEHSTLSDSLGQFAIECKKNDKLVISATGFKSKKIKVKNLNDSICVNLLFKGGSYNAKNVIDSGYLKEADLNYAINNLSFSNTDHVYTNVIELIESRLVGVQVLNNAFYVQRTTDDFSNNTEALIVIDDVQSDFSSLQNLPVSDIKKVEVLKGADAVIYGGAAAYGVIVVTTKDN